MAKTKDTVKSFLDDLVVKLNEPLKKEFDDFLKIKEKECAENNEAFNGVIAPWDIYHYMQVWLLSC